MAGTKDCPNCEVTIADTEEVCPGCKVNIAEFEDTAASVDAANRFLERKKKKAAPQVPPVVEKPKLGKLASLGSLLRKGK